MHTTHLPQKGRSRELRSGGTVSGCWVRIGQRLGGGGGDGTAVHMEGTPCLQYQDLALVPDPPISVASDRSINLPETRFSNYKVFLKGAAGD